MEQVHIEKESFAVQTHLIHSPSRQAYHILHAGFVLLPLVAGLDKFVHVFGHWHQYLAPVVANAVAPHVFMKFVGGVEIAAGLLAAFRPKLGGYIIAAWLGGIIINLALAGGYGDIALRDFALMLGALALARLSVAWGKP